MLFNSYFFLFFFLPLAFGISALLKGRLLMAWVVLASLVFYAGEGNWWYLWPLAVTACLDYFIGRLMSGRKPVAKRALLVLSLTANLGLLFYFKYAGLFADGLAQLSGNAGTLAWLKGVALPAGISFYTFQSMSYVIDVYRGEAKPERSLVDFIGFVSFFPHLVAGPLTRHDQLLPQLKRLRLDGIRPAWREAVFLVSTGLIKKVLVGDSLEAWASPAYGGLGEAGLLRAWLLASAFAAQIYFDFSGYCDMAMGLSRLFGVELPQNFKNPYRAADPSDFWRRWHITLSLWLRDYLYISLGGNRKGEGRTYLNLIITMALGGLWHGASWTFGLWGVYHGVLLAAYRRYAAPLDKLPLRLRQGLTFALICLGWTFFKAGSLAEAWAWQKSLFFANGLGSGEWAANPGLLWPLAGLTAASLTASVALPEPAECRRWALSRSGPYWALLGIGLAFAVMNIEQTGRFLYFKF